MADRKITDLTALAAGSQATGDLLTIVDVSEGAAADKNKKITVESLFKGIPSNVGIGTSSPSNNLEISSSTGGIIRLTDSGGGHALLEGGDGNVAIQADVGNTEANSKIQFFVDNSEKARIDSSGRVGIGTTSPAGDLQISGSGDRSLLITGGTSGTTSVQMGDSSDADAGAILYDNSDNSMRFKTNASERMRIDSSGNLQFQVNDGVTIGAKESLILNLNSSGGQSSRVLQISDNGTARVTFQQAGNVGIGHDSPASLLTVGGDAITTAKPTVSIAPSSGNGSLLLRGGSPTLSFDITSGGDGTIIYDTSSDLLFKNGTLDSSTERMRIDSSGRLLVGVTSGSGDIGVILNKGGTARALLARVSQPSVSGGLGSLAWGRTNGEVGCTIGGVADGNWSGSSYPTSMRFSTVASSSTSLSERMRIRADGRILMNCTQTDDTGILQLRNTQGSAHCLGCGTTSTGSDTLVVFRGSCNSNGSGGATRGSISVTASATAYNTTSDYRLKENVVDLSDAITRVKQLAPKRFNFIVDADTTVDGFLAHEAQAVVPEAVTGTHNEVDDDGNAVMQGIDQSKLVPLLTAALQEAIAEIETLKTKVAALEAG